MPLSPFQRHLTSPQLPPSLPLPTQAQPHLCLKRDFLFFSSSCQSPSLRAPLDSLAPSALTPTSFLINTIWILPSHSLVTVPSENSLAAGWQPRFAHGDLWGILGSSPGLGHSSLSALTLQLPDSLSLTVGCLFFSHQCWLKALARASCLFSSPGEPHPLPRQPQATLCICLLLWF